MYIQKNTMTPLQLVIFFLVLGALLVAGFFLTMALLPLILVLIVYFWFKIRKAKKNFQQRFEQMQQERQAQEDAYYQSNQRESLYGQEYQYTEQETQSGENFEATRLKYINPQQKKQDDSVVYDISPNDYTIEEKK